MQSQAAGKYSWQLAMCGEGGYMLDAVGTCMCSVRHQVLCPVNILVHWTLLSM